MSHLPLGTGFHSKWVVRPELERCAGAKWGCVPGDLRTEPDCVSLLSVSWPPCFPTRSSGRHRAAGVAQLELSVCISDTLRGSNHQGRSFQQQVWLHCNLLRAFYAPWTYSTRKSSLSVWAGDHFLRLQKRSCSLPGCVRWEADGIWTCVTFTHREQRKSWGWYR